MKFTFEEIEVLCTHSDKYDRKQANEHLTKPIIIKICDVNVQLNVESLKSDKT